MRAAPSVELLSIIDRTRYLLLDFDGPICSIFAGLTRRVARGCLTPGLPPIPCVTVSRHTARVVLIVRTTRPMPSGRRRWGPGG